ncbi:hypothetical protein MRX96_028772 [Rhipicephalus microplus]
MAASATSGQIICNVLIERILCSCSHASDTARVPDADAPLRSTTPANTDARRQSRVSPPVPFSVGGTRRTMTAALWGPGEHDKRVAVIA